VSRDRELEAELEQGRHPAQPPVPSGDRDARALAAQAGNAALSRALTQEAGSGILADGTVHPDVTSLLARTRGGGHELDGAVRAQMSPRVGDTLEGVRVHTDATAQDLAHRVDARAFTTGTDVYFGAGEYQPGSTSGDALLAHELTHVAQQRGAPESGPLRVSEPGDAQEAEADAVARGAGG
jgi:hypothetical protein